MPNVPMFRVRTVVTGVAGSPYYMNGYFAVPAESANTEVQDAQAAIAAWHAFVSGTANSQPAGSVWTTEGQVPVIQAGTGDILRVVAASPAVLTGTGSGAKLPPSSQLLVRWTTGVFVTGRQVRGRTNVPVRSVSEADANGRPTSAAQATYLVRATALVSSNDAAFGVWARSKGTWENATGASVWGEFAVLRSRRD